MANTALASGSVVLTANADQMTKGLADAEKKAEMSFHKTESKLNKAAQKYFKKEGGFLGTIGGGLLGDLGLAGGAGVLIGLVLAMKQVAHWVDEIGEGTSNFNKQLEKSNRLSDSLAAAMGRVETRQKEWIEATVTPSDRAEAIRIEMERLTKELTGVSAAAKLAEKDLSELKPLSTPDTFRTWVSPFGDLEKLREEPKSRFDRATKSAGELGEKIASLRVEMFKLMNPSEDPKLIGDFQRLSKELVDSMKFAGLSPEGKMVESFRERGLPEGKLRGLEDLVRTKEEFDRKFEASKGFDKFVEELEFANQTASMTAEQAKLFKARIDEVDERKLILAQRALSQRDPPPWMFMGLNIAAQIGKEMEYAAKWGEKLAEPLQLAGAVEAGTRESYSLSVRNQFGGETGRKLDDIKTAIQTGTRQMMDVLHGIGVI